MNRPPNNKAPAGGIMLPNTVQMHVNYHPAPFALPVVLNLQTAGGLKTEVFGGFTKLEEAALRLAAANLSRPHLDDADDAWRRPQEEEDLPSWQEWVVNRAAEILAECERRQSPAPESTT